MSSLIIKKKMESKTKIRNCTVTDNERDMLELLNAGLDPNFEGGWPIRLAARHGSFAVVRRLIQFGANPHLMGETGASTLQLAVYSGRHWDDDSWTFLLSCCDSSQLADGAAVAIIFRNIPAFKKILETGRCNTHIPTTLTGKTLEQLAKGYKLQYLLNFSSIEFSENITPISSPQIRRNGTETRTLTPQPQSSRNLSPSVARFFDQTANQASLTTARTSVVQTGASVVDFIHKYITQARNKGKDSIHTTHITITVICEFTTDYKILSNDYKYTHNTHPSKT